MHRLLAPALIAFGAFGLLTTLPHAFGYYTARVTHSSNVYTITSTNPLVQCSQPNTITLRRNQGASGSWFLCSNRYNAPVDLTWAIVSDGGSGVTISGSSGSMPAGTSDSCRAVTLTAANTIGTFSVVYRGTTASTADFYAQIEFPGQVVVQNGGGGLGGSCP